MDSREFISASALAQTGSPVLDGSTEAAISAPLSAWRAACKLAASVANEYVFLNQLARELHGSVHSHSVERVA